ncbi:helix-turn-helix domain-containing protein [Streptomyces sp. NPDC048156]|uniref:helix-turn-helix domain-containing protein n=1 Tax=Streptomyces sp. NPDC048156 TaxID=3365502 RepID=UPI0037155397
MDIAEDLLGLAGAFHDVAFSGGSTVDILRFGPILQRLKEDLDAAAVGRGRALGESADSLAQQLALSPETLRKKLSPEKIEHRLGSRKRPTAVGHAARKSSHRSPTRQLRSPQQRLAAALSYLQRRSSHSQQYLAQELKASPSYVSRLLSGQRQASWKHVKILAQACGTDPELLRPLWNTALGSPPPAHVDPVDYLRTYLAALKLAHGAPDDQSLAASTKGVLSQADVTQAFTGPGLPTWEVARYLASALSSHPDDIRPLWRAANSAPSAMTSSAPAEAFG